MSSFVLVIFCSIFVAALGDDDHQKIKEECMKENSITESDLKMYPSIEDVPEAVLCFGRCLNIKVGFLDENGKINLDKMDLIPGFNILKDEKAAQLTNCFKEIDTIAECSDVKKFQHCFPDLMKS